MLVFVASSGKSLELGVEASTRVATIMETLVGVTGVPTADQILMCGGSRLDAGKDLGAYSLPAASGDAAKDVFLFDKSLLRPGGRTAPEEPPKPLAVAEPVEEEAAGGPHALDSAASPLVRALPQLERQFRHHVRVAAAGRAAAAQRHADCSDLVSEMEVQSRAIDSARLSVELHYTHTHAQLAAFTQEYEAQRQAHAQALGGLEAELAALARVPLHPAARAPGRGSLLDLVDAPRLRERAGQCAAAHAGLAAKVGGLQALFGQLRAGVEAVFMQGPSVQLEALATRLHATRPHLDELADVEAVLAADAGQVSRLVAAAAAPGGGGAAATPLDAAHAAEAMLENHEGELLPRVAHTRAVVEHFYGRCLHDKNQMARDVAAQLQRVSGQQMRIQAIRNQLAAFRAAAAKEAELLGQLQRGRRAPAAYRHCLAECMRRQAFADVYAGQARQMAERMGRLRQKECAARDAFAAAAAAAAPPGLLAALGLTHAPPHCQVSVPPQPALPRVTPADLRAAAPGGDAAAGLPPPDAAAAGGSGEPDAGGEGGEGLEMENARLRAELALRVAQESAHALAGRPPPGPAGEAGGPELRRVQAAASAAQDLAARLDAQLGRARAQCAAYEARIGQLEDRLGSQAASLDARAPGTQAGSPPGRDAPLALTPVVRSPTRAASPAAPPLPEPPEAAVARASLAEALHGGDPEAAVRVSLAVSGDGSAVRLRVAPRPPGA